MFNVSGYVFEKYKFNKGTKKETRIMIQKIILDDKCGVVFMLYVVFCMLYKKSVL